MGSPYGGRYRFARFGKCVPILENPMNFLRIL